MINGALPKSWTVYTHPILRVAAGLGFLHHGTGKLLNVPDISAMLAGMPAAMVTGTGLVDLIGGFLILAGAFTRSVAFVLSGYMAVGYFMAHAPMSIFPLLNYGEPAYLYCFVFLWLATAGAGAWSLDATRKAA